MNQNVKNIHDETEIHHSYKRACISFHLSFFHFYKMNTEMSNFEKLEFSPFDLQNILLDNENDPDENFFNIRRFSDTSYFTIEELSNQNYRVFIVTPFQYSILMLGLLKRTLIM